MYFGLSLANTSGKPNETTKNVLKSGQKCVGVVLSKLSKFHAMWWIFRMILLRKIRE